MSFVRWKPTWYSRSASRISSAIPDTIRISLWHSSYPSALIRSNSTLPFSWIDLRALRENQCNRGPESILITYPNSCAFRLCSFSHHVASSRFSSERNLSNHAITCSSLFFTRGDTWPGVSERNDKLFESLHVKFQECTERRLDGRVNRQYKW